MWFHKWFSMVLKKNCNILFFTASLNLWMSCPTIFEGPYLGCGICLSPLPSYFPRPSTLVRGWGWKGARLLFTKWDICVWGWHGQLVYNREVIGVAKKGCEERKNHKLAEEPVERQASPLYQWFAVPGWVCVKCICTSCFCSSAQGENGKWPLENCLVGLEALYVLCWISVSGRLKWSQWAEDKLLDHISIVRNYMVFAATPSTN